MNLYELYLNLKSNYPVLNPHHDTWLLWTKQNKNSEEIFEVVIGTILVQNTNWKNVDKTVALLKENNVLSFEEILSCEEDKLIKLIRPTGFYNQKMQYLKSISELFIIKGSNSITRKDLLNTKGIGKETADSILTYCLDKPFPIVGTYTKRFFAKYYAHRQYLKLKYELIQEEIDIEFNNSKKKQYELGLFHALIVVHSQNICIKKAPKCDNCFLKHVCKYKIKKSIEIEIDGLINDSKRK